MLEAIFDSLLREENRIFEELHDPHLHQLYKHLIHSYQRSEEHGNGISSHTDLILNYLWERLHDGKWLDIHTSYRYLYGYVTAIHGYYSWISSKNQNNIQYITNLFRLLDLGILLGSSHSLDLLQNVITLIQSSCPHNLPLISNHSASCTSVCTIPSFRPLLRRTIPIEDCPNLLTFSEKYFISKTPVVLRNCISDWPALNLWSDLSYINSVAGYRTVPIEIGRNYLSESSGQKLMTMNEFICNYILPHIEETQDDDTSHQTKRTKPNPETKSSQSPPIAYLAQHCLFDHIPIFKSHYMVPDYCCLLSSEDEEDIGTDTSHDEVIVNGWFGPIGTISPLHHDPYHNILAQVCGYKYVRLYSPQESDNLYPMCQSSKMSNNSQVDLLNLDEQVYPNVLKAEYYDVILCPGDMLFIPRWWWHYITAVSYDEALLWESCVSQEEDYVKTHTSAMTRKNFSWSINFWWGKRLIKDNTS